MGAALLAAFLLCEGFSLAAAPAASAHDQLISSSPAPDERLDKTPANITLAFSSPLLTLGHEVRVVDGNAKNWVSGAPVLTRETLTQPLPELPDGGYQVSWRVVSADGHPISGGYRFHVGDPSSTAPADGAETGTVAATGAGGGAVPGWLPAAGIAAAAGLGIFLAFTGLRRIKRKIHSPSE